MNHANMPLLQASLDPVTIPDEAMYPSYMNKTPKGAQRQVPTRTQTLNTSNMKYFNTKLIILIVLLIFILPFSSQAQLISDGSFELAGAVIGSGNSFSAYPTFTNDWTAVNTDGEVFNDGNAFDGDWYADLLQNGGLNSTTFWNETNHETSGYDRILTTITGLDPNTNYTIVFHHSTQLNRFGYLADQTLVQFQSVQTNDADSYTFNTPTTNIWESDTVNFTTDASTTSVYLLFSPLGLGNSSVSIDKISISNSVVTVSTEDIVQANSMKIYPNPTSNSLTLNSLREMYTIEIYDITGKQILHLENLRTKDLELSMDEFPAGIYTLVAIDADGEREFKRIIKN